MNEKIAELERTLQGYRNLTDEHRQTVSKLRGTISKVIEQRDDATKQLELIANSENHNNATNIQKQQELIKKNKELSALADKLAANLERKEKSLEEALLAINTLQGAKQNVMGHIEKGRKLEKRKSITDSITNTFTKLKNRSNNEKRPKSPNSMSKHDELSVSLSAMSLTTLDAIVDDYEQQHGLRMAYEANMNIDFSEESLNTSNNNNKKSGKRFKKSRKKKDRKGNTNDKRERKENEGNGLSINTKRNSIEFSNSNSVSNSGDSRDRERDEAANLSPNALRQFAEKISSTVRNSFSQTRLSGASNSTSSKEIDNEASPTVP